jgi:hypothetical protein
MDPLGNGSPPSHIPRLSVIKQEKLISPIHVIFSCYHLLNGYNAYHGQMVNLEQKNVEWLQPVPMWVQDLPYAVCLKVKPKHQWVLQLSGGLQQTVPHFDLSQSQ